MMSNHKIILILSLIFLVLFSFRTETAKAVAVSGTIRSSRPMTVPFGGRILSTTIPSVTCTTYSGGTAPILLSSNLAGVASAGFSAIDKNQGVFQRTANIGSSIYKAIPLYTLGSVATGGAVRKQPKVGDWILGRQKLIPNFSTCQTTITGVPIPFPVVETNNYGVSQSGGLRY